MNEDLIDHEFVDNWCAYYDELKEHCQQFTPEWAAAITGVSVEDIVASARLYANADRGAIQWGLVFDAGTSFGHALDRGGLRPDGHLRQHREARHARAGAQLLRHQRGLLVG